jgi:thiamine pyrophosphokinase
MKTIGICGGAEMDIALDSKLSYIGVDRGIETLWKQGLRPIVGVGDFDSIEHKDILDELEIECLPTRKDITDTHYAIQYAIDKGYDEIFVYGVTGGRLDHYMAVLCLLEKYRNVHIIIMNQQNRIELLSAGKYRIQRSGYQYFSIFALVSTYVTLSSCEYPLDNYYLVKEDPLCVSNQMIGDYADIEISEDIIFIQSKDKD